MFAMFLPSFFSGWLIARIGVIPALWIGLLLMAGTVLITFAGQAEAYYMVALVLLGAGWNFLFIGGTTLLASAGRGPFKYRVQGINEMVMFGTMAVGSLVAGPLLHNFGWVTMNLVGGALLLLVVVAILRARTGVRFNDEQLSVRTQSD
jgi:MFS family permease